MAALREAETETRTRTRTRVREREEEPGCPDSEVYPLPSRTAAATPRAASHGQRRTLETLSAGASADEITQTGEAVLRGVIQEEVEHSGDPQAIALSRRELGGAPQSPPGSDTRRLIECVRRIGDELDQNAELQRMMEEVECEAPKELFFRVASGIFDDGRVTWGRVVALFYFSGKLAVKILCQKIPKLVRNILGWAVDFLRERVVGWIKAQGGWKSLLSYFTTTTWKTIGIVTAGTLIGAITGAFAGAIASSFKT